MNTTTRETVTEGQLPRPFWQRLMAATERASKAISCWTGGQIALAVDEICKVSLAEATAELGLDTELLNMIVLTIDEGAGGQIILAFDDDNAKRLAALLTPHSVNAEPAWTELELSALHETGNILGCAYLNGLSWGLPTQLVPSVPYFLQDYAASVLQQAMLAQASCSDQIILCRTGFRRRNERIQWHFFFVPSAELLATLSATPVTDD